MTKASFLTLRASCNHSDTLFQSFSQSIIHREEWVFYNAKYILSPYLQNCQWLSTASCVRSDSISFSSTIPYHINTHAILSWSTGLLSFPQKFQDFHLAPIFQLNSGCCCFFQVYLFIGKKSEQGRSRERKNLNQVSCCWHRG